MSREPEEHGDGTTLRSLSGTRLTADGSQRQLPPLSLYIHIPWCVRKCPYCDFNSHNAPQTLPQDDYVAALLQDLDQDLPLAQDRPLASIFFGGGTPSLFAPDRIARILDGVAARLSVPAGTEVTLETNPGTVEHGPFADYRRAGVNRISFGVQSFDDDALRRIGRIHDAAQAERAIRQAQDAGIDNLNLDLMYALPQQTLAGALGDVDKAILLQTPHLSHYQLTLEPNTAFAANPPPLPDDDLAWDMQEACQQRLADAGLAQYEVSAYARPGRECRHNLNYWQFGDYLGIGAGAHGKYSGLGTGDSGLGTADSRLGGDSELATQALGGAAETRNLGRASALRIHRRWKVRAPRGYLEHAASPRRIGGDDLVAVEQLPFEFMLNALRLNRGFSLDAFAATTGLPVDAIDAQLRAAIARGWLEVAAGDVRTTEFGRRFLNDVVAAFLPGRTPRMHNAPRDA
ncbi:MAG TPA: radical SAM family heme chaperone HemW [Rudaea sp.]|jgi:oxygen-independent coproporphyrinogen-3 oxidase